jgi:hypothetical protein
MLDQSFAAFDAEHGTSVESIEQEHYFMDFYPTLDEMRAKLAKPMGDSQIHMVRPELSGVQECMVTNIRTALIREEKLSEVGDLSESLSRRASAFEKDSVNLNRLRFGVHMDVQPSLYLLLHWNICWFGVKS